MGRCEEFFQSTSFNSWISDNGSNAKVLNLD